MTSGPLNHITGKRVIPWNPADMGRLLFDIQTMKLVESIPFMSTSVYCNGNKRFVLFDIDENIWYFPIKQLRMKRENGEYPYEWGTHHNWSDFIPKEIQVMATLLKD